MFYPFRVNFPSSFLFLLSSLTFFSFSCSFFYITTSAQIPQTSSRTVWPVYIAARRVDYFSLFLVPLFISSHGSTVDTPGRRMGAISSKHILVLITLQWFDQNRLDMEFSRLPMDLWLYHARRRRCPTMKRRGTPSWTTWWTWRSLPRATGSSTTPGPTTVSQVRYTYSMYIPHKDYQEILEEKVSCHVTYCVKKNTCMIPKGILCLLLYKESVLLLGLGLIMIIVLRNYSRKKARNDNNFLRKKHDYRDDRYLANS